jgi:hypothetical protein
MALLKREDMDEFQVAAYLFLERVGSSALWIDMGLGKTVVLLTRISDKIFSYDWTRALVVAPPLVASDTWPTEIKTWEHTRHLTCQQLEGETADMRKQLKNEIDIDVISVHKLQRLAAAFKKGDPVPWDVIVLDEASMFRSKTSKRWTAAIKLAWSKALRGRNGVYDAERRVEVVELTGTPAPNGLHQVWAQIAIIDGGKRLGWTYTGFLKKYFETSQYSRKIVPRAFAMKAITRECADIAYTLREEDYVKLPPLRPVIVPIILPPTVMAAYLKFERTSVHKWAEGDTAIRALSEGALYGKLLQFACGRVYVGDEEKTWVDVHDCKINRVKEMIEFSDGKPILIARTWQHSKERLHKAIPGLRSIKTPSDIKDWNAGKIEFAECHPASIGHGTNIQHGGSYLVWYDHTPDLELFMQLRKRLHRRGQKADYVTMALLTAIGTIEEDLNRDLVRKELTQDQLREPMRRRIEDIQRELQHVRS